MSSGTRAARRVLVVGDLMLDEYLRGAVRRVSPEAPVPVLESSRSDLAPGGAANVANNLAALGCEVLLCGVIGEDQAGDALLELLGERGIETLAVVRDPERPTTHKLRVVAQGQHMLRIDKEVRAGVGRRAEAELIDAIRAHAAGADAVVLSDYDKGVLGEAVLKTAIGAARERGLPVAVDPKGSDYRRYRGAHVLTPNLAELELASGIPIDSDAALERAAGLIVQQTDAQAVLVTCGKDGMVLVEREGGATRIAAEAREVYDVTGAGDTVIAALTLGLLRGHSYVAAVRLANTAAGIVVGKLGTSTVSLAELEARSRVFAEAGKICERDILQQHLAAARRANKRIVFTNGCFDLLHPGHVDLLSRARSFGDLLVVGVNSDASVSRLKGSSRPILDEAHRARLVAALACVDWVVLFHEDTPAQLVAAVRPDVLVKGADYTLEQVVGRELVESYGGRVELVPLSPGFSTSSLIERVLERARINETTAG